jgi:cytochrome c553
MQSSCVRLLCAAVCGALIVAITSCNRSETQSPSSAAQPAATTATSAVERGKYLVSASGCHDCHSPKIYGPGGPQPDPARLLSGHPEDEKITAPFTPSNGSPWVVATNANFTAWSGPWGISFAANLTPDTNTGLHSGVWTEDLFIKAIRSGKHMGTSRDILPPMPWPGLSMLTDDDLKAIWAYLGTLKPITNHVPEPVPPAGGTK